MPTISQAQSPTEVDAVRELIREYTDWAVTLAEGSLKAPAFERLEEELAGLPGKYAAPNGALLLAMHKGEPAGCAGLRRFDAVTGELKRLYVRPAARGLNIGQRLVEAVLAEARSVGYRRMILDSHVSMTRAHAIYEAAGFRRSAVPDTFPDEIKPFVVFMRMGLE